MNDRSPLKTDNYSNKRKAEDRPQSAMNSSNEDIPAEGVSAKRGKRISQEELTDLISQIEQMSISVGDKCYMIPIEWWQIVLDANGKGLIKDVPQITTSSLFDGGNMKQNLTVNQDYCLATEELMSRLTEAFGVQEGHEIPVHGMVSQKNSSPASSDDENEHSNSMTLEELSKLIRITEEEKLTLGEKWFIVSKSWWNSVHQALKTGYPDDIGAINCEEVSQKEGQGWILKPGLVESADYVYLPKRVFSRFQDVFDLENAGRDYIEREVVRKGKALILQTYPRIVEVSLVRDRKNCTTISLTGDETMSELRQTVLEKMILTKTPLENLRFYVTPVEGEEHWEEIDPGQENLDVYFDTAQKVAIDIKDEEGNWFLGDKKPVLVSPVAIKSANVATASAQNVKTPLRSSKLGDLSGSPGTCGLTNLGNTCFMASAIQCLSNVPPLTEYFLKEDITSLVNKSNPLGTGGELAQAYAELIGQVWHNQHIAIAPRKLKGTIGQFAPRFSGYQQQDSQELLAYLLDGLHEDLNRIKQKPYRQVEDEESNKLEEHEAAKDAWQAYKARNDSIIVDTFHGQLKSRLVCPDCKKVSIKFDPFCFLSVPVPAGRHLPKLSLTLIYNTLPKKKWAKFSMSLTTGMCTVNDVINCVNDNLKQASNPVECCLFTVGLVSDNIRILNPSDSIGDELTNSYFIAQLDHSEPEKKYLVVKNRSREGRTVSVPMIYSYLDISEITGEFIENRVIAFTRATYLNDGHEIADDSYSIYIDTGEKPLPYPQHALVDAPDGRPLTLLVVWKYSNFFNNYRGEHLIEREVSVQKTRDVHLLDCIDLFTREEQLGEQDSWYCPVCKDHKRATKKLDLWSLPQILIIHLKRFHYGRFNREKIEDPVLIPVRDFELNDKLANDKHDHVKYDLIACSNHSGGLGGGHYTATAKNINGKWYEFNDSWVTATQTPPNPWLDRNSYVLVYQRKQLDPAVTDHNLQMETE